MAYSQQVLRSTYLEQLVAPGQIDKGITVDVSSLLLGQLHLDEGYLFSLLLAFRNVLEHCNVSTLFFDLAQHHARHEVSENVGVTGGIVLFNLPQTLVEGKFRAVLFL